MSSRWVTEAIIARSTWAELRRGWARMDVIIPSVMGCPRPAHQEFAWERLVPFMVALNAVVFGPDSE